jgi:uncharacterized membrane protein YecN with MAPEG domain
MWIKRDDVIIYTVMSMNDFELYCVFVLHEVMVTQTLSHYWALSLLTGVVVEEVVGGETDDQNPVG